MRRFLVILFALSLVLSACVSPINPGRTPAAPATITPPPLTSVMPIPTNPPPATTVPPTTTAVVGDLTVHFLDVGQGDAEIVTYGNQAMLIDAGTNASTTTLLKDIRNLGITRFDVIVATHPHEDHIGGLDAVINQFAVGTIYMPKVAATTKTFTDVLTAIKNKGLTVTTPTPGTTFSFGPARCTILAPNGPSYADINNHSIVIRLAFGNTSFLFTGDAEAESEKEMLSKGYNLKSDVLKVGHHGSNSSTSPEFLKAVAPKVAVISVGAGNDYGHPHKVTIDKLAGAGVRVYRTDLNGSVTITSDGSQVSVTTLR
jgi:competence protein ComEC